VALGGTLELAPGLSLAVFWGGLGCGEILDTTTATTVTRITTVAVATVVTITTIASAAAITIIAATVVTPSVAVAVTTAVAVTVAAIVVTAAAAAAAGGLASGLRGRAVAMLPGGSGLGLVLVLAATCRGQGRLFFRDGVELGAWGGAGRGALGGARVGHYCLGGVLK
jgi:hypothetical protein